MPPTDSRPPYVPGPYLPLPPRIVLLLVGPGPWTVVQVWGISLMGSAGRYLFSAGTEVGLLVV